MKNIMKMYVFAMNNLIISSILNIFVPIILHLMFVSLIHTLPCFVCLMWMLSFSFQVKSQRQKVYVWSLAASLIYYLAFSTMAKPETEYSSLIYMDVILLPLGLAMFSLLNVFVHMHLRRRAWSSSYLLWLAPSLCIGVAGALMYALIGFDNAILIHQMYDEQGFLSAPYDGNLYRVYLFISQTAFNVLAFALGLTLAVQCGMLMHREGYNLGDVSRFFFARHSSTPGRVTATLIIAELLALMPLLLLSDDAYRNAVLGIGQALLLALIKHCQCHVVFFSDDSREVTLHALSHLRNSGIVETGKTIAAASATDVSSVAEAEHENKKESEAKVVHQCNDASEAATEHEGISNRVQLLSERLRVLMEQEEIWRDDTLTISTLADRLGVSRTTVSNMINACYNQSVRDLIGHYRIEAVKRYLLENPTATQEAVAASCGFKTASYLNCKFKEAVGTTPLLWLMSQNELRV